MIEMSRLALFGAVIAGFLATPAAAQLRGHGGPVRALAIAPDGGSAISGSFDTSAIRWSLVRDAAVQVLRFHEGAVDAVAFLKNGSVATAGEDARIAIWTPGEEKPSRILEGHAGPVVALAPSPDGTSLASASWDGTVRIWPLADGPPRVLEGHRQNVNGVAFTPDGAAVVSAGYDATLRIWPLAGGAASVVAVPAPLNAVATAPDGEILAAGADGKVYVFAPDGERRAAVEAASTPLIALALSGDGSRIAAASIRGSVAILDRGTRTLMRTLVGPGLPVWSTAFLPDGSTLLTGGADRMIRRWNTDTGEPVGGLMPGTPEDPLAAYAGDPGAEVFRACVACHAFDRADSTRAGPSLHGIFGRHIATLPGYSFSEALRHLDITWTPETVARLFELGPSVYTPGTKMPDQRIGNPADRDALVRFLERVTR